MHVLGERLPKANLSATLWTSKLVWVSFPACVTSTKDVVSLCDSSVDGLCGHICVCVIVYGCLCVYVCIHAHVRVVCEVAMSVSEQSSNSCCGDAPVVMGAVPTDPLPKVLILCQSCVHRVVITWRCKLEAMSHNNKILS